MAVIVAMAAHTTLNKTAAAVLMAVAVTATIVTTAAAVVAMVVLAATTTATVIQRFKVTHTALWKASKLPTLVHAVLTQIRVS